MCGFPKKRARFFTTLFLVFLLSTDSWGERNALVLVRQNRQGEAPPRTESTAPRPPAPRYPPNPMASELYERLGYRMEDQPSDEELKRAYRELAREFHPDRNPGNKNAEIKFKSVQDAWDIFSDPDKRFAYDYEARLGINNQLWKDFFGGRSTSTDHATLFGAKIFFWKVATALSIGTLVNGALYLQYGAVFPWWSIGGIFGSLSFFGPSLSNAQVQARYDRAQRENRSALSMGARQGAIVGAIATACVYALGYLVSH